MWKRYGLKEFDLQGRQGVGVFGGAQTSCLVGAGALRRLVGSVDRPKCILFAQQRIRDRIRCLISQTKGLNGCYDRVSCGGERVRRRCAIIG